MALLPGVRSHDVDTDRLRMHYLSSGPDDGEPIVMIHGNLATGRFFEHVMTAAPDRYRIIAPDMRNFGDTESVPLDATRGVRDWADDTFSLVETLGIEAPVHLAGWSTGGFAIAAYAFDRPAMVASLTFIDPVSPYGFGGTKDIAGTKTSDDFAGSGAGSEATAAALTRHDAPARASRKAKGRSPRADMVPRAMQFSCHDRRPRGASRARSAPDP